MLLRHCKDIMKYSLTDDEERLLNNYRSSNRGGKNAISEFAEFMANKCKQNHKEEKK